MPICMQCGAFFTGKQCSVCIATASKKPKSDLPSPTALIAKQEAERKMDEKERLAARINELNKKVEEKEDQIRQVEGTLSRKNSELEHSLKEKDEIITQLKAQLEKGSEKEESVEVRHLNERIMDLEYQLKDLKAKYELELEKRQEDHSTTEIRHLNENIMDLQNQLKAQEAQFKTELNKKDDNIQELQLRQTGTEDTNGYEEELNQLRAQIRKKDAIIATQERKISQLEQTINE